KWSPVTGSFTAGIDQSPKATACGILVPRSSCPGLTWASIFLARMFSKGWIAGSSPAMTPLRDGRADLQRHHHGLRLGVKLQHLAALLAAPAGLLVAAERHRRVERAVHVDADGAGADAPGHLVRGREVARPDAGGEPIGR